MSIGRSVKRRIADLEYQRDAIARELDVARSQVKRLQARVEELEQELEWQRAKRAPRPRPAADKATPEPADIAALCERILAHPHITDEQTFYVGTVRERDEPPTSQIRAVQEIATRLGIR